MKRFTAFDGDDRKEGRGVIVLIREPRLTYLADMVKAHSVGPVARIEGSLSGASCGTMASARKFFSISAFPK